MLTCTVSVFEKLLIVQYYAQNYGKRNVQYSNALDMETEINNFLYEIGRMNTHKIHLERFK